MLSAPRNKTELEKWERNFNENISFIQSRTAKSLFLNLLWRANLSLSTGNLFGCNLIMRQCIWTLLHTQLWMENAESTAQVERDSLSWLRDVIKYKFVLVSVRWAAFLRKRECAAASIVRERACMCMCYGILIEIPGPRERNTQLSRTPHWLTRCRKETGCSGDSGVSLCNKLLFSFSTCIMQQHLAVLPRARPAAPAADLFASGALIWPPQSGERKVTRAAATTAHIPLLSFLLFTPAQV